MAVPESKIHSPFMPEMPLINTGSCMIFKITGRHDIQNRSIIVECVSYSFCRNKNFCRRLHFPRLVDKWSLIGISKYKIICRIVRLRIVRVETVRGTDKNSRDRICRPVFVTLRHTGDKVGSNHMKPLKACVIPTSRIYGCLYIPAVHGYNQRIEIVIIAEITLKCGRELFQV